MNNYQKATKTRKQIKEGRLEIVAILYKRGYNMRQIRAEIMKRLNLETYSLRTVHRDVHTLLDEWRENRLDDMDKALQLELERIDETVRELWEQWEKSKEDYTKTQRKRKGAPRRNNGRQQQDESTSISPFLVEQTDTEVIRLGDPAYIAEIRKQLEERRKLLGLYAPERKVLEGQVNTNVELMNMTEAEIKAEIARITGSIGNP